MNKKNSHDTLQKKIQLFKWKIASLAIALTPICMLVKNKRAVSAVMSNLILLGAVIGIGLVALGYTRSTSISYQTQYAEEMNSDIIKLKENLSFEYVHYDAALNKLHVYFLNCGTLNVEIEGLTVGTSNKDFSIYQMDGPLISDNVIVGGQEGHLESDLSGMNLQSGTYYSVKLTTGSESTFAYNFLV